MADRFNRSQKRSTGTALSSSVIRSTNATSSFSSSSSSSASSNRYSLARSPIRTRYACFFIINYYVLNTLEMTVEILLVQSVSLSLFLSFFLSFFLLTPLIHSLTHFLSLLSPSLSSLFYFFKSLPLIFCFHILSICVSLSICLTRCFLLHSLVFLTQQQAFAFSLYLALSFFSLFYCLVFTLSLSHSFSHTHTTYSLFFFLLVTLSFEPIFLVLAIIFIHYPRSDSLFSFTSPQGFF